MRLRGMHLHTPVSKMTSVGQVTASRLKRLHIEVASDLLYHFPFRYDDYSVLKKISELRVGDKVSVCATIEIIENRKSPKKKMVITEAILAQGDEKIKCVWFNQRYLVKSFSLGDQVCVSGIVEADYYTLQFVSPTMEHYSSNTTHTGRIVPNYPLTGNITPKQLRFLVRKALECVGELHDTLPIEIVKKYGYMSLKEALFQIHFPDTMEKMMRARERLSFDELFFLQLHIEQLRKEYRSEKAFPMRVYEEETHAFIANLPFKLTSDQEKVFGQIIQDIGQKSPMNRLLEGDVGSGKTIVAALAMFNVVLNGYQAVIMAPTEVLARQHYESLCDYFSDFDIHIGLLTGKFRENTRGEGDNVSKKTMYSLIATGALNIVIGTHALIQEGVKFKNLGFVVIDEQHRFGVEQRKMLKEKTQEGAYPHLLSMTATPIPRTLALAVYGDLDISILREMPKGRKEIFTRVVSSVGREKAYTFITQEVKKGRQVFVICPLIELSDKLGVKAVSDEYEYLAKKVFPDLSVGMLHGRMKSEHKKETLQDFKKNSIQILVSTSVVEVGIDVANATIMMIEGAERFGLAQLHQFRGRVGRGDHQSYCFLFASDDSMNNIRRLKALVDCHDGFELAEKDLELRGPGEVYGRRQSGLPDLKIAEFTNVSLLERAKNEASKLLLEDPELKQYPELKKALVQSDVVMHLE